MDFAHGFGTLLALVMALTWVTHYHVLQKIGMLFLGAWAVTNIAVHYGGFTTNALVAPSIDAAAAILIAILGYTHRSEAARIIVILYLLVEGAWLTAYLMHAQLSRTLYDTLGVLFFIQLTVLGGASAWLAIRNRTSLGGQRLRFSPTRR